MNANQFIEDALNREHRLLTEAVQDLTAEAVSRNRDLLEEHGDFDIGFRDVRSNLGSGGLALFFVSHDADDLGGRHDPGVDRGRIDELVRSQTAFPPHGFTEIDV